MKNEKEILEKNIEEWEMKGQSLGLPTTHPSTILYILVT
jgi:hypothetical protein